MNRQIEEMTKLSTRCAAECEDWCTCSEKEHAEILYNAGYRKASEVARDIINEIDDALHKMATEYVDAGHPIYFAICEMVHHKVIRPIEKKYESECGNGTNT